MLLFKRFRRGTPATNNSEITGDSVEDSSDDSRVRRRDIIVGLRNEARENRRSVRKAQRALREKRREEWRTLRQSLLHDNSHTKGSGEDLDNSCSFMSRHHARKMRRVLREEHRKEKLKVRQCRRETYLAFRQRRRETLRRFRRERSERVARTRQNSKQRREQHRWQEDVEAITLSSDSESAEKNYDRNAIFPPSFENGCKASGKRNKRRPKRSG